MITVCPEEAGVVSMFSPALFDLKPQFPHAAASPLYSHLTVPHFALSQTNTKQNC